MHLPLAEGRELYVNIQLVPSAGKGITNFGGDNLEVTGIMYRVEHPNGNGNDRYGQNMWLAEDVTYDDMLNEVKRAVSKFIPERTNDAVGDFYEDSINEDAVAALPEDAAIQLHVVDILNPGMTDHSMKSKIESLNTLLPKISDKKLSELDKEYGDDKDMGTHIKAEVARRENEGIFKKAERIAEEAKAERKKKAAEEADIMATDLPEPAKKKAVKALHGSASMTDNMALSEARHRVAKKKASKKKVKPEQQVGDLFAGLFDKTSDNGTENNDSSSSSQAVAGGERSDTVGVD